MQISIIKYALITSARDRLYIGLFLIILLSLWFSYFMGTISVNEQSEVSIVYAAGSARIVAQTGLCMFAIFHVKKMFEGKEIDFILSRPVSRSGFAIAYCFTLLLMSILAATLISIAISIMPETSGSGSFVWGVSLAMELFLTVSCALLFSVITGNPTTSALSCLSFVILARVIGFFADTNTSDNFMRSDTILNKATFAFLNKAALFFPRFDLFCKSEWIFRGVDSFTPILIPTIQTLIYAPLTIAVACWDMSRKEF